ncbi:MAG TPA: TetR family transcriptional regulator C-terminal domain-containing protein [Streptosporangiaceae bacterium]|nr:TetR family transcriptional regulator C-terminal domain-containing protein [Streptosporangiaceae bacterium]
MPKIVDHETRRREIATALWRVVRRHGVEGATVRAVAAEAGCSPSALRHYFVTQDELLTFTMRLVAENAHARIAALPDIADPSGRAERVLSELLPLDDERRTETHVWIAFNARALVDPKIRTIRDSTYDAIRDLCRKLVVDLTPATGARLDLLARQLNVLLDGLALHAALRPDLWSPRQVRAVLRHHLDALSSTSPGG